MPLAAIHPSDPDFRLGGDLPTMTTDEYQNLTCPLTTNEIEFLQDWLDKDWKNQIMFHRPSPDWGPNFKKEHPHGFWRPSNSIKSLKFAFKTKSDVIQFLIKEEEEATAMAEFY